MRDDYDRDDREKRRHRFPWWKKLLIKAGIYVALVLAAAIAILIGYNKMKAAYEESIQELKDEIRSPYEVSVDFGDVILGESAQQKELIVMKQDAEVPATIKKSGFLDFQAFEKSQVVIYHGHAQYTVDLSEITEDDVIIDDDANTITIMIPKPSLEVIYEPEHTQIYDESRGLLAFGDIEFTAEETKNNEMKAKILLYDAFTADAYATEQANKYAMLTVQEIYQPLINQAVDAAVKAAEDEFAVGKYYTVRAKIKAD